MANRLRESAKNQPEPLATTKKLPVASGFTAPFGKQSVPSMTARKLPMPKANAVRLSHT